MNKTIRTMLAFLVVISMIAPAMANGDGTGITAWASGSASSVSVPIASTEAYVTLNGMLSTMRADVNSGAEGNSYANSMSGAYGVLDVWDYAEIGAYTGADAADATANAEGSTSGMVHLADTYVEIQSNAEGETANAKANVGTIASWYIYNEDEYNPGVMSNGYAQATFTGDSIAEANGDATVHAYPWFQYGFAQVMDGADVNSAWVNAFAIGSLAEPEDQ